MHRFYRAAGAECGRGKRGQCRSPAKLALDIANKTLPLFRHVNAESLRQVCEIIRHDIHADAVAITNIDHVLAYVGVGEHNYRDNDDTISPTTRQAINYGKIIIKTMMKPTERRRSTPCW